MTRLAVTASDDLEREISSFEEVDTVESPESREIVPVPNARQMEDTGTPTAAEANLMNEN